MTSANKLVRSNIETRFSSPVFLSAHPHVKSLFSAFPNLVVLVLGLQRPTNLSSRGHTFAEKGTSTQLSKQYVLIMIKSAGERLP